MVPRDDRSRDRPSVSGHSLPLALANSATFMQARAVFFSARRAELAPNLNMTISDSEAESLRFHLGLGNISLDAEPYTPDGHQSLIALLVANLTTAPETSCASAITAGLAIVTPASMTGILPYTRLVVDVGADVETVTVQSTTLTTFSARFQRAHAAGVPCAVLSGHTRLRTLLWQADVAWQAFQDPSVGATAGLRSVDKGDVVWADGAGFATLNERQKHYRSIVAELSSLVRVAQRNTSSGAQTIGLY